MTNSEAIKIIQERIDEMLKNEKVQKIMTTSKREGKTDEEIRNDLVNMAIASLVGA